MKKPRWGGLVGVEIACIPSIDVRGHIEQKVPVGCRAKLFLILKFRMFPPRFICVSSHTVKQFLRASRVKAPSPISSRLIHIAKMTTSSTGTGTKYVTQLDGSRNARLTWM